MLEKDLGHVGNGDGRNSEEGSAGNGYLGEKDIFSDGVRLALRIALSRKGITQKELAKRVGISEGVLSHYMRGRRKRLNEEEKVAIAKALDLPPESLLSPNSSPPADISFAVLPHRLRLIPVFPLGAGYDIDFNDGETPVGESLEEPIYTDISDPNAFACRLVGSSMEGLPGDVGFFEGDTVVFDTKAEARNGCFCLVRLLDDGCTFKQIFFEDDNIRLHPLNPEVEDQVVPRSHVHAIYRAVRHIRRI